MFRNQIILILLSAFLLLSTAPVQAQFHTTDVPMEERWELANAGSISTPKLIAVLTIHLNEGWHTYAHTPGELGKPTTLKAQLANGNAVLPVIYPLGKTGKDTLNPQYTVNVYGHDFRLYIPLPQETTLPFVLNTRLELLFCSTTSCLPGSIDMPFKSTADIKEIPKAQQQEWWAEYAALAGQKATMQAPLPGTQSNSQPNFTPVYQQPSLEVSGLGSAILFGLLAGLILNVMPCVLPVVSIKLSSLMSSATHEDSAIRIKLFREHNLLFSAGVLTWFTFLALLLGFTGQTWGVIFQSSAVVIALITIVFLLSLSLFGLFTLPIIDLKFGTQSKSPRAQAFFTGIFATLLATPCSGPFLGGVLGWALVQQPQVIIAVFISIGLGMSLPYLLFAVQPSLVRFMPKPGPWIAIMEKGVGFFLIGTCIYLLNILPGNKVLPMLIVLWMLLPVGWLLGRVTPSSSTQKRIALRLGAFFLALGVLLWAFSPSSQEDKTVWAEFDSTVFTSQLGKKTMILDFTADWCPTCKVLEQTVLTSENITRWSQEYDVEFIKVDLTKANEEGERLLRKLGAKSIPTAALFPAGKNAATPLVLRDMFTSSQLEKLLESYTK